MFGSALGDIIGSRFEFRDKRITKDFELFSEEDRFTDDTVMTVTVAQALLRSGKDGDEETIKNDLIERMQYWGRRYPDAGYGRMFRQWLKADKSEAYGSWGNGSAMRAAAAGCLYDSLERSREVARWTAEVTHDHPEGIKGAECTAAVINLGRTGKSKEEIREFVIREFGYDLDVSLDELRGRHLHEVSCMDSLPKALVSFLEGDSFEEVVRNAVCLGGDTDTNAAIAGAMAEGFYEIPKEFIRKGCKYLTAELLSVLTRIDIKR